MVSGNVTGVDANGWNEFRVDVTGSVIKVYINGRYLGETTDTTYVHDPYFGTYFGAPEVGDGGVKWDYFEVKAQ